MLVLSMLWGPDINSPIDSAKGEQQDFPAMRCTVQLAALRGRKIGERICIRLLSVARVQTGELPGRFGDHYVGLHVLCDAFDVTSVGTHDPIPQRAEPYQ